MTSFAAVEDLNGKPTTSRVVKAAERVGDDIIGHTKITTFVEWKDEDDPEPEVNCPFCGMRCAMSIAASCSHNALMTKISVNDETSVKFEFIILEECGPAPVPRLPDDTYVALEACGLWALSNGLCLFPRHHGRSRVPAIFRDEHAAEYEISVMSAEEKDGYTWAPIQVFVHSYNPIDLEE